MRQETLLLLIKSGINPYEFAHNLVPTPTFIDFFSARDFSRGLGIKSQRGWIDYSSSGSRPNYIPARPDKTYKNNGWVNLHDWLGIMKEEKERRDIKFLSFKRARNFARSLKITSKKEWVDYCCSGKKSEVIPDCPNEEYRWDWNDWDDWLGVGVNEESQFLLFDEARNLIQSFGLKSQREWQKISSLGKRPKGIPSHPEKVYEYFGWINWSDFLGYLK